MLTTYDLNAVRHFTKELSDKRTECDNGEGMVCSTLQETITHYANLGFDLRTGINEWARAVFTGQVEFDQNAEDLLKTEANRFLTRAKDIAALGRSMNGQCFELQGLNQLHYHVADFDYLLKNWVRPHLATSPSPRTKPSEAAKSQAVDRLERLPPLPKNWEPADLRQRKLLQNM